MDAQIEVLGARTNNLKNISCRFPHGALTVVSGVSGSGKSSLVFDTLYAEGQRRYIESMSTYARQFLEKMRRPDVDAIHNIQPAIAIEQKNHVKNARSTIGTATEIHDYLRLLFAKTGHTICPECGIEVKRDTPQSAADALEAAGEDARFTIVAPVIIEKKTAFASSIGEIRAAGFARIFARGGLKDLEEAKAADRDGEKALWVVVDRVIVREAESSRLHEALELAFRAGHGRAAAIDAGGQRRRFYAEFVCAQCERRFREPEPLLFSFMSPLGACETCQGYGRVMGVDWDKVIPNRKMSLTEHPIAAWNTPANEGLYDYMFENTVRSELPRDLPLCYFGPEEWKTLLEGNGEFVGLQGFFDWLDRKKYKIQNRVTLARYRSYTECPDCGGTRLKPEALCVKVDGRTIAELARMAIADLAPYFAQLRLAPAEEQAAGRVLTELRARLDYLNNVGLGYLTLARQTRTLSGGEAQRINLATALGSSLTDTLYVLDEPTIGLHARDTDRLLTVIQSLKANGNTLAIVEHDPEVIAAADRIIDLGPAAGEHGGQIIFEGPLAELLKNGADSQTAAYQRRRGKQPIPSHNRKPSRWLTVRGARAHNLKNIDVRIPLGVFTCVTGVSGSGKSTLVQDVVYSAFQREREMAPVDVGEFDRIEGFDELQDIVMVDQNLLGRSTRSNPVTYIKAYDAIRQLLAGQREARRAGITAGDFSFNVAGGRCERCAGTGVETIDMHFLADVEVVCGECDGKRFQRRILDIQYNGKNIDDILDLTVDEAVAFFADQKKIIRALRPLREVGLGYVRLGQNTTTMSGGEAQRLKLAFYMIPGAARMSRTAFFFDEPTTGLHAADLEKLLAALHRLVDEGATVVAIEHNLDFIGHADHVIDLGPEGGDEGGRVVAEGTVKTIIAEKKSITGKWLGRVFGVK